MKKSSLILIAFLLVPFSMSQTDGSIAEVEEPSTYHNLEDSQVQSKEGNLSLNIQNRGIGRFQAQDGSGELIEYHFAYYSSKSSWILRIGKSPHTTSTLGTIDFADSGSEYIEYTSKEAINLSQNRMLISNQSIVTFSEDSRYNGESLITASSAINQDTLANASIDIYDLYVNPDREFERTYVRWVKTGTEEIPDSQVAQLSREKLIQKLESKNEKINQLQSKVSDLETEIERINSQNKDSRESQTNEGLIESVFSIF